jgi:hypothetical protein
VVGGPFDGARDPLAHRLSTCEASNLRVGFHGLWRPPLRDGACSGLAFRCCPTPWVAIPWPVHHP